MTTCPFETVAGVDSAAADANDEEQRSIDKRWSQAGEARAAAERSSSIHVSKQAAQSVDMCLLYRCQDEMMMMIMMAAMIIELRKIVVVGGSGSGGHLIASSATDLLPTRQISAPQLPTKPTLVPR